MIKQYLRNWDIQGVPADAEVASVEVEYKLDVIPVDSRHSPGVTIMITGTATIYMEHFREVVNETHYAGRDIVNQIYKESKEVVDLYGFGLEDHGEFLYRAEYEAILEIDDLSKEDCKANLYFAAR